jgi:hypothetical protein
MKYSTIDNPTGCKVRAVIRFRHSRNVSAVDTNQELYTVFGQNIYSKRYIRQLYRMFKDVWETRVHDGGQTD